MSQQMSVEELFFTELYEYFGGDIAGSDSHPLKSAFELYVKMKAEEAEAEEELEEEEAEEEEEEGAAGELEGVIEQVEGMAIGGDGGKCSVCKKTKLIGRFKEDGVCGGCHKAAAKEAGKEEKQKEKEPTKKEKEKEQKKKEKEHVRTLWTEALGKERDVRAEAWLAERALFYHLPKPARNDTAAYVKWRRWHDTNSVSYVGDKYPNPDHDPYAEEEEEEAGAAMGAKGGGKAAKGGGKAAKKGEEAGAKEEELRAIIEAQAAYMKKLDGMIAEAKGDVVEAAKEAAAKEAGAKEAGAKEEERKGKAGKGGRRNPPRGGNPLEGHPLGDLYAHCLREGNFQ